jgi:hypothetical protein
MQFEINISNDVDSQSLDTADLGAFVITLSDVQDLAYQHKTGTLWDMNKCSKMWEPISKQKNMLPVCCKAAGRMWSGIQHLQFYTSIKLRFLRFA